MRSLFSNLAAVAAFTALAEALTFTSPSGGTLDATRPVTITWTSTSSDPATFDLVLDNPGSGYISNEKVATGISTSAGSYTLSSTSLYIYGSGFVIKAEDAVGTVLATSASFSLAQGGFIETTDSNGNPTLLPTSNNAQPATSGGAMTMTPTGSEAAATGSATATGMQASNSGMSSNTMHTSTTSTHRSPSSTSSSASSSASANAQPRLMSGSEIVLSAAGVLAGFVALLA